MMRVMVIGARGLLGTAITRAFSRGATVLTFDRSTLDLADAAGVEAAVSRASPDVIINCGAYNDVDGAEEHAETALTTNALGVSALARSAAAAKCTLIHYSSDFVFGGEVGRPYTEADRPNPRSVYGLSKLLGEWFALEGPRAYVLRVESLFGTPAPGRPARGSLAKIVSQVMAGEEVVVFEDRVVSPAFTSDVAAATHALVARNAPFGLYHCVNSGQSTWVEIAAEAARLLGRAPRLKPIPLATARLKAERPRYCALSTAKLETAGITMPAWQDALARHLKE